MPLGSTARTVEGSPESRSGTGSEERAERLGRLRELAGQVRPLVLARDRRLPVLPALEPLLPGGGLQRGSTVALSGPGSTALLQAVIAGPTRAGSWAAWVGAERTGWGSAAELGVALERVVVVDVDEERRAVVLAALVDAVDLVVVGPSHRLAPGEARRIGARVRERGSVLLTLRPPTAAGQGSGGQGSGGQGSGGQGSGGQGADVRLECRAERWSGLGEGWGRLTARCLTVSVEGRGVFDRPRRWELWLPGPEGIRLLDEDGLGIAGREATGIDSDGGKGTGAAAVLALERRRTG